MNELNNQASMNHLKQHRVSSKFQASAIKACPKQGATRHTRRFSSACRGRLHSMRLASLLLKQHWPPSCHPPMPTTCTTIMLLDNEHFGAEPCCNFKPASSKPGTQHTAHQLSAMAGRPAVGHQGQRDAVSQGKMLPLLGRSWNSAQV